MSLEKAKVNLSCLQCQQRKRKCNKSQPCQACEDSGNVCTAVYRARLPRGRQVIKHSRADLMQRVATLEKIIASHVDTSQEGGAPESSYDSLQNGDLAWAAAGEEVGSVKVTSAFTDSTTRCLAFAIYLKRII